MRQKICLLLVAILGMSLPSMAQTNSMPKIQKFVEVTATGVNFRQAPTTASKKLGWTSEGYGPELGWVNNSTTDFEHICETILPVIGESGDWYKVHLSIFCEDEGDTWYVNKTAYIMKKFCRDLRQKPLTLPATSDLDVKQIKTGPYKDFCLYLDYGDNDKTLYVGKYIDGMFVFTNKFFVFQNIGKYYQNQDNSHFVENDYGFETYVYDDKIASGEMLDLYKLINSPRDIQLLMTNMSKSVPANMAFYGIEGDNEWHVITFDGE